MAMYNEIAKQIVERKSILAGRMMENLNRSTGDSPLSSFDRSFSLPVSMRNRLVLRCKMMTPEVSLIRINDMKKNALACMN